MADLHGAYALGVVALDEPQVMTGARMGCPLLVGLGELLPAGDYRATVLAQYAHQPLLFVVDSFEHLFELVNQLEQTEHPRACGHGRPTMLLMSQGDLARQFSRRVANDALDHVESAIHSARANVQPAISRLATQAESLARKGLDAVKDGAYTVRDRATSLTDVTARYVKDEPVKAVLIAAAAGAALMALLSLAQSGRRRDDL